ncbi:unnamed protein product [Calicophoron daubneyi]|uniref:Uncharacterized protein n=1 Tax=Calicophoron daubneyi TaxID=300641 RepID=A0AAV2TXN1_CALDB
MFGMKFTGLLDIVIIPAVFSVENDHLPIRLGLENAFGLSIFCGLLIIASGAMALRTMISGRFTSLRKFYLSLWINLLLGIAYWCCFVWAICKGLLTLSEFTKKTSNALLVTRIFTGTNVGLSFVPNLTGIALYWKPVMSVCCGSYDFPVPRSQSAGRFGQLSAAFHSPRSQLRRTRLHHGDESSSDGLSTSDVAPLHL